MIIVIIIFNILTVTVTSIGLHDLINSFSSHFTRNPSYFVIQRVRTYDFHLEQNNFVCYDAAITFSRGKNIKTLITVKENSFGFPHVSHVSHFYHHNSCIKTDELSNPQIDILFL